MERWKHIDVPLPAKKSSIVASLSETRISISLTSAIGFGNENGTFELKSERKQILHLIMMRLPLVRLQSGPLHSRAIRASGD